MGAIAQLFGRPAVKAATALSVSEDGTFIVAPGFSWLESLIKTPAGTFVSDTSAMALPTLAACVRVIAESVASIPLIVYRRLPTGGKDRASDHDLYPVLHDSPNPEMTSFVWRETLLTHMGTWGNCYHEVTTDAAGRTQIWPLPPDRIEVGWESSHKVFDYVRANGTKKRLKDGTVFHIPALGYNGLVGKSPVQIHREALGEAMATRDFGSAFYRHGARPAVVLEHPKTLSTPAIERLGTQMEQLRGVGNAGKTVILEEGLKLHEVGVPPEDAQYIETRKFQREEICTMYRMPPHMVGVLDHATFSNIEHQSIDFVVHTLRPWLVRIEQAINQFFFADDPEFFVEFLVDGLLRGDAVARAQSLDIQRKAGVLHKNEWREIENRNPDPEDDIWVPAANNTAQPIDDTGAPIEDTPDPVVQEPPAVSPDVVPPSPQLVAVKSADGVRCTGCRRLLAEVVTPPYRIVCSRCKAVTEAA